MTQRKSGKRVHGNAIEENKEKNSHLSSIFKSKQRIMHMYNIITLESKA